MPRGRAAVAAREGGLMADTRIRRRAEHDAAQAELKAARARLRERRQERGTGACTRRQLRAAELDVEAAELRAADARDKLNP